MSTQSGPLISTTGIWYAYFPAQIQPGDNVSHPLTIEGADAYGNASLFDQTLTDGVGFTHRATINVDVHAECEHEVAIERTLGVHNENAGVVRERGQSIFAVGQGNAAYQGIIGAGETIKAFVSAPGDQVSILNGYISVSATPI